MGKQAIQDFVEEKVRWLKAAGWAKKAKGLLGLLDEALKRKDRDGRGQAGGGGKASMEDAAALSAFRHAEAVDPSRPPVVAVVGVTKSGKSRLLCQLFGEREAFLTKASIDTTDKVFRSMLENGLVIVDTAGVGGDNDFFENTTRAYLGLPQRDAHGELAADGELQRVDRIPVCSVGNQRNCPLRRRVPCTIDGKDEEQLVMPLAFEATQQKVYRKFVQTEGGGFRRLDPEVVSLPPCATADDGTQCRFLELLPAGQGRSGLQAQYVPDVIIVLAAGPRGGFHRAELDFVRQLRRSPHAAKIVFAVNVWDSQDSQAQIEVQQKVEDQVGEPPVLVNASTGRGIRDLVERIGQRLPGATSEKFNYALLEALRRSRNELAADHILDAAVKMGMAQADATVRLPEVGEDIPEALVDAAHLVRRLADLHRVPESLWVEVGGDFERLVADTLPEVLRRSGIEVEYVEEIKVPEVREKKIRIPRGGIGGWLSRTFLGDLFGMEKYEYEVQSYEVEVTKKLRKLRREPGRGGPNAMQVAFEVGLGAHWRFGGAAGGKAPVVAGGGPDKAAASLIDEMGPARLKELCNAGDERGLKNYLVENLPEEWVKAR